MQKYRSTIKGYLARLYHNILTRCNNKNHHRYFDYGGRGIECKFKSLNNFRSYIINDLGFNTRDKINTLQIDRIDNNGHYEKGNIRFVTCSENQLNKRKYRKKDKLFAKS
jgi:hypothetical protein